MVNNRLTGSLEEPRVFETHAYSRIARARQSDSKSSESFVADAWASRRLIDFTVRIFIGASPEVGASPEAAARTAGACSGQCNNDLEIMLLPSYQHFRPSISR